ncbi:hypothetical protein Tco_0590937 [Tanacetum coccineum]
MKLGGRNNPAEMKDECLEDMQTNASSTIESLTGIDYLLNNGMCNSFELEEGSNLQGITLISLNHVFCQLAKCINGCYQRENMPWLMFSSLPISYKSCLCKLKLTGRPLRTFENEAKEGDCVKMKNDGNDSSSVEDKLLLADDSRRGRNFQRGSSKGHSKSRMGGDRDMIDGGEMNVVDNGGDEFLVTETLMDGILREEKPKWMLDNAASSHICNTCYFNTLNGKDNLVKSKRNKQMMKIEGVGSVRFKLHDGSMKTALNVKYVPSATRNILSLGVLTSRGYRYVGRKDTCKVYKRDQLVIRGRKIPNNLCYFTWKWESNARETLFCRGNKRRRKKTEKRVHFLHKDEYWDFDLREDLLGVYFKINIIMFWRSLGKQGVYFLI